MQLKEASELVDKEGIQLGVATHRLGMLPRGSLGRALKLQRNRVIAKVIGLGDVKAKFNETGALPKRGTGFQLFKGIEDGISGYDEKVSGGIAQKLFGNALCPRPRPRGPGGKTWVVRPRCPRSWPPSKIPRTPLSS